jgi:hypothetical protein
VVVHYIRIVETPVRFRHGPLASLVASSVIWCSGIGCFAHDSGTVHSSKLNLLIVSTKLALRKLTQNCFSSQNCIGNFVKMKKTHKKVQKHSNWHYLATVLLTLLIALGNSILWIITGLVGLIIFQLKKTPFNLIIGLPLCLIGAGMLMNALLNVFYATFSPDYNRGLCRFCRLK